MKEFMDVPAEKVPVFENAELCVVGGSCTGVFAALRAARMGVKTVLVERQNRFGGVATLGLVGMWHTFFDTDQKEQIIKGLTYETCERLEKYGAVSNFRDPEDSMSGVRLNPEYLALELDEMVRETPNLTVYFHTAFSSAAMRAPGEIEAIVLEGRGERFAIRADYFIDATGDGFLCRSAGTGMYRHPSPQPATACMRFINWDRLGEFSSTALRDLIEQSREKYPDLPCGYNWGMYSHGSKLYMLAGTRILHGNTIDTRSITAAELESRRQVRALDALLRDHFPEAELSLQALPSMIGIRDGLHIRSIRQLTGSALLNRAPKPDAIANGTYPVDIHSDKDDSITFRFLSGFETVYRGGRAAEQRRWLPEGESLPYYQIPLSALLPDRALNFIAAGRMIDADPEAFGAVRVMVNLNQCGEAAGVTAALAVREKCALPEVSPAHVRGALAEGGSIVK
ncbi:MAG: ribulose-1,5-biphosphate synthetase [Lentisphaerae bacterium ADurb.Bin242]|nr:MAG: ribulose-1,5-biphosphate synthetase [Lentisphaerae bacterium ADurb.Bin242]